jgi:hypothetical protein
MRKLIPVLTLGLLILVLLLLINMSYNTSSKFAKKGLIVAPLLIGYVILLLSASIEFIVYCLVVFCFLDVPMFSLYTTSTNLIILISVLILFLRGLISEKNLISLDSIKRNRMTLPLLCIIGSYALSLAFVRKGWASHLILLQGIICASFLVWMIIGTIREERQIIIINKIMLAALIGNLCFSCLFLLFPQIDSIRAIFFSMGVFESGEGASRLQGLSFRGEAYGEYLMICGLWLFAMLLKGQFKGGRSGAFVWLITFCTIVALILTRLRGANAVFLLLVLFSVVASTSIPASKKIVTFSAIAFVFAVTLVVLSASKDSVTLLDRFSEFLDEDQNIGYVPQTRYYTWMPSFQMAKRNWFMGIGPSFVPYNTADAWKDLVADEASGEVTVWPHNITLMVLCTVGIYGLVSYLFLVSRAIQLRKVFNEMDPFLKSTYSSYLLSFVGFLIEGQKFDGALRNPGTNFFFIWILIALLFTCESLTKKSGTEYSNREFGRHTGFPPDGREHIQEGAGLSSFMRVSASPRTIRPVSSRPGG